MAETDRALAIGEQLKRAVVALDCESVLGHDGKPMLARVAMVDWNGKEIYDSIVKIAPALVKDYKTPFSGMTPEIMAKGSPLEQVLSEVNTLLSGKFIMAHGIHNDLKPIGLAGYPYFWDLAAEARRMIGSPYTPSVRTLVERLLGEKQKDAHNPVEDARYVVRIFKKLFDRGLLQSKRKLTLKELKDAVDNFGAENLSPGSDNLKSILERMERLSKKRPPKSDSKDGAPSKPSKSDSKDGSNSNSDDASEPSNSNSNDASEPSNSNSNQASEPSNSNSNQASEPSNSSDFLGAMKCIFKGAMTGVGLGLLVVCPVMVPMVVPALVSVVPALTVAAEVVTVPVLTTTGPILLQRLRY